MVTLTRRPSRGGLLFLAFFAYVISGTGLGSVLPFGSHEGFRWIVVYSRRGRA